MVAGSQPPTPQTSPPNAARQRRHRRVELRLEGVVLDESSLAESPMLPYVRMVVSLIEGVELSCREVLYLLRRSNETTQHRRSQQDRLRSRFSERTPALGSVR